MLRRDAREALKTPEVESRHRQFEQLGTSRLYTTWKNLDIYLTGLSPEEFATAREELGPYLERLGDGMVGIYDYGAVRTWAVMLDTLSAEHIETRRWLKDARVRLNYAADREVSAIYDSLLVVRKVARSLGDPFYVPYLETDLAYRALDFDPELGWRHARQALQVAESMEERETEYQVLGLLAFLHSTAGDRDSSLVYLEEGLSRAVRTRYGLHATRLSLFLANWYEKEGRFAVAEDLREQGLRYAEELVAGPHATRLYSEIMQLWGDRECWEAVERYLPRARMALREARSVARRWGHNQLLVDGTELRLRVARGEVERAEELITSMDRVLVEAELMQPRMRDLMRANVHDALLDLGRPEPVRAHLDTVLRNPDVIGNIVAASRLGAQHARALLLLGRPAEALEVLSRREAWLKGAADDEFEQEALVVDAWLEVDRERARDELVAALGRLVPILETSEPSPASYFLLNNCERMRRQSHLLWGHDARSSYELELAWRSLPSRIGRRPGQSSIPATMPTSGPTSIPTPVPTPVPDTVPASFVPPPGLLSTGRQAVSAIEAWIEQTGGTHYLFALGHDSVCRWTHGPGGVIRDTLEVTPTELRNGVANLLDTLDPSGPSSEIEWAAGLRLLHRQLVGGPTEEGPPAAATDARPVLWTVPDFLRQLPPGLLNVGVDGTYEPWASRTELAIFRPSSQESRTFPHTTRDDGLMLVNPTVSPGLTRRFPEVSDLAFAELEGKAAAAHDPRLRVLRRESATKDALLGAWESVGFLHLATHLVRRPENPYLTFVPLAGADDPDRSSDVLEIIDVRRADLSGCDTVVLSGCDTGAPVSVRDGAAAPTLAEAFLDAGAGAVVQTFWPVRDDAAARLVAGFLERRGGGERSDVRALRDVQVEEWKQGHHPYEWGAFGTQLGISGLSAWTRKDEAWAKR